MRILTALLFIFLAQSAMARIQLSSPHLDMGVVELKYGGLANPRSVMVMNTGETDLQIQISGACSSEFRHTSTCSSLPLKKGMSCTISVTYQPNFTGFHSCSLQVEDRSSTRAPSATLHLRGEARRSR